MKVEFAFKRKGAMATSSSGTKSKKVTLDAPPSGDATFFTWLNHKRNRSTLSHITNKQVVQLGVDESYVLMLNRPEAPPSAKTTCSFQCT